mmetsp:Transcript_8892/g.26707  ORF Transcript_8892/g.26707 Transcript_8892/m.26707 type:complete len:344 (-) Transcript_8892:138-1169(-)|eukprot:CAMPEP_0198722720 /NCGR_PEP_ID=MMETSP1475-20131203/339_1 /TAXON_ID= ORGANISM="Unidentified sp., Strain CCMP1999" /NCGR_SAMPLE_ID=MMETSP1475 /ASSEMBLY_ACC=CAM_ASM_001111 /LENGTH=343 /DNA_ID=CAMNT_0044483635 /DNA_START=137 /DNA_END=1168 /DNA_ORIENTATION=+
MSSEPGGSGQPNNRKPSSSQGSGKSGGRRTGITSLSDLTAASSGEEEGQDYFAGGFNSGLNVHDPNARETRGPGNPGGRRGGSGNELVDSLINKATRHGPSKEEEEVEPAKPSFNGPGYRLGDDAEPAEGSAEQRTMWNPPPVPSSLNLNCRLTLYRNGFTVEDGPLRRYDEPANRAFLQEIERGFIPEELSQNRPVREVSIKLEDRKDEDYVPPKKKMVPFSGTGNRLGSTEGVPTEQPSGSNTDQPKSEETKEDSRSGLDLDPSKPKISVQIRLADGRRFVAQMNDDHTISDLRSYIESQHNFGGRSYELSTTFPRKVLSDTSMTVKDANLDGAVVVVTVR